MSRRKRVETGIYVLPGGGYQVAIQATVGAASPTMVGGIDSVELARAYRAVAHAAAAAGAELPTVADVADLIAAPSPPAGADTSEVAGLWAQKATDIDATTFRWALRGIWDTWERQAKRKDVSWERRDWVQRCVTRVDAAMGTLPIGVTRDQLEAYVDAEVAAGTAQSTLDALVMVCTKAVGWAVQRGLTTVNPVAVTKLEATSTKEARRGIHRLQPGSLAWAALAVLHRRPGVTMSSAQIVDAMVTDGTAAQNLRAGGCPELARKINGRLSQLYTRQSIPQLTRPAKARYMWDPDATTTEDGDELLPTVRRTYVGDELRRIARALPDGVRVLLWLMVIMGLRTGEAMGLRIEHLDLERQMIRVRHQAGRRVKRDIDDGGPKTCLDGKATLKRPASVRNLPVPDALWVWLVAFIIRHHGDDAFIDPVKRKRRIMVPATGPTINPGPASWLSPYMRAVTWVGMQWRRNGTVVSPYDLRHSCSQMLRELGVPWVLRSAWLGHALGTNGDPTFGSQVTMDTYTHVDSTELVVVAEALDKAIRDWGGLDVDDSDLEAWTSTAEACRILGCRPDSLPALLGDAEDFDDPRAPRVSRAYRTEAVLACNARLDTEVAVPVAQYAADNALTLDEVRQQAADGVLDVRRRYYRRTPGGPLANATVVTVGSGPC